MHIVSTDSNDLVNILKGQKSIEVKLYSTALDAAQNTRHGEGILVLADAYPDRPVELGEVFFELVEQKSIRVYVEFPSRLPGIIMGGIERAKAERAVVNSGFFGGFPDSLGILGINGLHYISIPSGINKGHIVAAKVAGFDSAIYGLPEKHVPLLFEFQDNRVLVSTTNLSRFVTGRYAPAKEWGAIWKRILKYVYPDIKIGDLEWEPVVSPTYSKEEKLPDGFQRESLIRGIEWYKNARMLIPISYEDTLNKLIDSKIEKLSWSSEIPVGDGSNGVFECIFSEIDENGSQPIGIIKRGDCISETSMAFATAGRVLDNPEYMSIAKNLLDYYLFNSIAMKKEYGDPEHPAYGLIPAGFYTWYPSNYGDGNSKFLMAALITAALTDSEEWDGILMRSLLALLRTTGVEGFRGNKISLAQLEKNGWQYFYYREIINPAPHREGYLWACYLWAYDKTRDELFLERAKKGIYATMNLYPDDLFWMNGLSQEKARMLLPLAWLVRVEDTAEHRDMLMRVVNDIMTLQNECGAIREELGDLKLGTYPPPQTNNAYGTAEASLTAKNGDPVSDLLYTTNFAFLGLHEALYSTKNTQIRQAVDKLAKFFCRAQVVSEGHPELDGGWMRAFDYNRFEHWGSNADHGWGAWAIETGWTQSWITTVLALRELNTSVWDLTKCSKIAQYHKELKNKLLPIQN